MAWKFEKKIIDMESRDYLKEVVREFNDSFVSRQLILDVVSLGIKKDISTEVYIIVVPKLEYKIEIFRVIQPLYQEYPIEITDSINSEKYKCNNIDELYEVVDLITGSNKVTEIINNLYSRAIYL